MQRVQQQLLVRVLVQERLQEQLQERLQVQQAPALQAQQRAPALPLEQQWRHRNLPQLLQESSSHHASIRRQRLSIRHQRRFSNCEFPERQQQ